MNHERDVLEHELDELGLPDPNEPPCDSCDREPRLEGDTLCQSCRNEIDAEYEGELP